MRQRERHLQPRLADRLDDRVRGGERLLLARRSRDEDSPGRLPPCAGSRPPRRSSWRRNSCRFPAPQMSSMVLPSACRIFARSGFASGPIIGQREIELQNLGGEGLDRRILAGVDAIGGPDQKAEDESGQQRQQADDRADHVARTARGECFGQEALQDKADRSAAETPRARRQTRISPELMGLPEPQTARVTGCARPEGNRTARFTLPARPPPTHASMKSSICRATARMSNSPSTRLRPARASSARRSGASMKRAQRRRKPVRRRPGRPSPRRGRRSRPGRPAPR